MGYHGMNFDFGSAFEDIAKMAREFGEMMREKGPDLWANWSSDCGSHGHRHGWDWRDYDSSSFHFYPPVNRYISRDGSLVLEFALAGIDQSSASISFQGDYLLLSAKAAPGSADGGTGSDADDGPRFYRRGFKPRDIEKQKYSVPAEDFAQDRAKAVFRNGVLTVTIPPKEPEGGGIKVDIVKEGD